ncbi:MAG: YfhO family protein [Anaerolineae bacterium]|nr:YfhO family protein [Anaerolineae bacterium]
MPIQQWWSRRRYDLASSLVLLLLATLFLCRALVPGNVLLPLQLVSEILPWSNQFDAPRPNGLISDPFFSFYPRRAFFAAAVRSGQLPLWNPYMLGGYPLAGDINAQVFYPFNWLAVLLVSPARSFALLAWFHLGLTGLLMYGFLRSARLSPLPALLGGSAWMLNGVTIVWLENPHRLSTAAWLPGLFWLFELALRRRRRLAYAAGGGLMFGLMVLGGQPQYAALGGLYLAAYALFRSLAGSPEEPARSWKPLLALAVTATIGLAVGSLQLLPAYEFTLQSHREIRPLSFWLTQRFPLHHTVAMWLPDLFGTPVRGRYAYWGPLNYAEYTFYFGLAPFLLALAAPLVSRKRVAWFLAVLAGLTLLAAWGSPLVRLAQWIPGMSYFSLHRMLSLIPFLGSWLAALALEGLLRRARALPVLLALAATLVLLTGLSLYLNRVEVQAHWAGVGPELARGGLLLTSCLLLLGWIRRQPRLAALGVTALTCIDLFQWGMPFNPVAPTAMLYPRGETVEWLQERAELARVLPLQRKSNSTDVFGPNILSIYGLGDPTGYCAQLIERQQELLYTIDPFYPDHPEWLFGPTANLVISRHFQPLHSLLSIRFVLSSEPLEEEAPTLHRIGVMEGIYIYENPAALPRAYLVHQAQVTAETRTALLAPSFDPRVTAILADPLPAEQETALAQAPAADRSHAVVLRYQANQVELRAETSSAGLLVLTDPYYPGWQAFVDGQEVPILRVNHSLRGVFVPAGTHQVLFCYRPRSVIAGGGLAAAGLIGAAAIMLLSPARRRPPPAPCPHESGQAAVTKGYLQGGKQC